MIVILVVPSVAHRCDCMCVCVCVCEKERGGGRGSRRGEGKGTYYVKNTEFNIPGFSLSLYGSGPHNKAYFVIETQQSSFLELLFKLKSVPCHIHPCILYWLAKCLGQDDLSTI